MLAKDHKKFQRSQHSEIYLLTFKDEDKTKMELPVRAHFSLTFLPGTFQFDFFTGHFEFDFFPNTF